MLLFLLIHFRNVKGDVFETLLWFSNQYHKHTYTHIPYTGTHIHSSHIKIYIFLNQRIHQRENAQREWKNPTRSDRARFPETALKYHPMEIWNKGYKGKMQRLHWFLNIARIVFSKEYWKGAESIQSDQVYYWKVLLWSYFFIFVDKKR